MKGAIRTQMNSHEVDSMYTANSICNLGEKIKNIGRQNPIKNDPFLNMFPETSEVVEVPNVLLNDIISKKKFLPKSTKRKRVTFAFLSKKEVQENGQCDSPLDERDYSARDCAQVSHIPLHVPSHISSIDQSNDQKNSLDSVGSPNAQSINNIDAMDRNATVEIEFENGYQESEMNSDKKDVATSTFHSKFRPSPSELLNLESEMEMHNQKHIVNQMLKQFQANDTLRQSLKKWKVALEDQKDGVNINKIISTRDKEVPVTSNEKNLISTLETLSFVLDYSSKSDSRVTKLIEMMKRGLQSIAILRRLHANAVKNGNDIRDVNQAMEMEIKSMTSQLNEIREQKEILSSKLNIFQRFVIDKDRQLVEALKREKNASKKLRNHIAKLKLFYGLREKTVNILHSIGIQENLSVQEMNEHYSMALKQYEEHHADHIKAVTTNEIRQYFDTLESVHESILEKTLQVLSSNSPISDDMYTNSLLLKEVIENLAFQEEEEEDFISTLRQNNRPLTLSKPTQTKIRNISYEVVSLFPYEKIVKKMDIEEKKYCDTPVQTTNNIEASRQESDESTISDSLNGIEQITLYKQEAMKCVGCVYKPKAIISKANTSVPDIHTDGQIKSKNEITILTPTNIKDSRLEKPKRVAPNLRKLDTNSKHAEKYQVDIMKATYSHNEMIEDTEDKLKLNSKSPPHMNYQSNSSEIIEYYAKIKEADENFNQNISKVSERLESVAHHLKSASQKFDAASLRGISQMEKIEKQKRLQEKLLQEVEKESIQDRVDFGTAQTTYKKGDFASNVLLINKIRNSQPSNMESTFMHKRDSPTKSLHNSKYEDKKAELEVYESQIDILTEECDYHKSEKEKSQQKLQVVINRLEVKEKECQELQERLLQLEKHCRDRDDEISSLRYDISMANSNAVSSFQLPEERNPSNGKKSSGGKKFSSNERKSLEDRKQYRKNQNIHEAHGSADSDKRRGQTSTPEKSFTDEHPQIYHLVSNPKNYITSLDGSQLQVDSIENQVTSNHNRPIVPAESDIDLNSIIVKSIQPKYKPKTKNLEVNIESTSAITSQTMQNTLLRVSPPYSSSYHEFEEFHDAKGAQLLAYGSKTYTLFQCAPQNEHLSTIKKMKGEPSILQNHSYTAQSTTQSNNLFNIQPITLSTTQLTTQTKTQSNTHSNTPSNTHFNYSVSLPPLTAQKNSQGNVENISSATAKEEFSQTSPQGMLNISNTASLIGSPTHLSLTPPAICNNSTKVQPGFTSYTSSPISIGSPIHTRVHDYGIGLSKNTKQFGLIHPSDNSTQDSKAALTVFNLRSQNLKSFTLHGSSIQKKKK